MKRFPKILQIDKRGQIVIPKDIRQELDITEGTGFYAYTITDEGILLKKIPTKTLKENKEIINALKENSKNLEIKTKNIDKAVQNYNHKPTKNKLEEL